MSDTTPIDSAEEARAVVRAGYARIAASHEAFPLVEAVGGCCGGTPCHPDELASTLGYGQDELLALPEGANLGLSCGNPTALATLVAGEVVLDLGSGGGLDVFIAARRVGKSGRAIGIDMTGEMLTKARRNLDVFRRNTGLNNAEFRLGEIEHLPAADESVDVVISNCVVNLSTDKPQVWREIARVLRPGGRVAISDMALLRPLPDVIRSSAAALIGCLAGAVETSATKAMAQAAGLVQIELVQDPRYVQKLIEAGDPLYARLTEMLPSGHQMSDYVTSLLVSARKPA